MTLIVTGVGSLIHIYSTGYMKDDASYARYFAYLNLFLFFMLLLVLGRSLLVCFVGWEGVGLASYLLIGFWFEDPAKAAAGKKAFITNRVGDAGFLLGMFLIYHALGTLDFDAINAAFNAPVAPAVSASLVGLLLFIGATGKSAQIPLHVWLPDAMAGPTPVSALIHAATMVTAGVYLVARLNGLYLHAPEASHVIAIVGARDGVLRGDDRGRADRHQEGARLLDGVAARLHVRRARRRRVRRGGVPRLHARVLQGLPVPRRRQRDPRHVRRAGHPQDGRPRAEDPGHVRHVRGRHRGHRRHPAARRASSPRTRSSGSRSRARRGGSPLLWLVASFTALMTAFYMFRLLWLTFLTPSRMDHETEHHVHESPFSMTGVLIVLAVLSAIGGFFHVYHFLEPVMPMPAENEALEHLKTPLRRRRGAIGLAGLAARLLRLPARASRAPSACSSASPGLHRLLSGKYYVDELYEAVLGRPLHWISERVFLDLGDRALIDGSLHGLDRPRPARRRAPEPRRDRQPAVLRAARGAGRGRLARVDVAQWLSQPCSTWSSGCRCSAWWRLRSPAARQRPRTSAASRSA